ncbi:Holin of 3TMs, for gene-transfer release [uncultured Caudovirales phage]|uniref:Holin of 3TMs, for gene-transfer release n=1 Tax=uncultured Caudovirales phage TaxID=2100421 RepID=A0A6J7X7Q9_9CAUD|nr:Holin of 3TMs, for gene-transfer release [uncultured Caudovirales phage]CAB5226951.1 Holin of 3TMs, for gene-transfer release [uncultured Caudovirales phage]
MFGIDDAITSVANLASTVVARIYPDATVVEKAKLDHIATEISNEFNLVLGQLEINKVEASNSSFFVAGARPAAMWVGVLSLFYMGIGGSLLSWVAVCFGLPAPPIINESTSTDILMGLLGLGGLRSFDKFKGTETKKI